MRGRAAALPLTAAVVLGVVATGCGQQDGVDLARQACVHVKRSIRLFEASERSTDRTVADRLAFRARTELFYALPIAAQATSADGQWNALMTTISEVARVDEGHLVHALTAQCRLADSNQPDQGPAGNQTVPGGSGSGTSGPATSGGGTSVPGTSVPAGTPRRSTIPGTLPGTPPPPGNGTLPPLRTSTTATTAGGSRPGG